MDWPEQALVSSAKLHGGYVKCAAQNHSSEQLADHSKVTLELVYRGYYIISFPDLLWTKPKARSGTVRKFVFLDWPLHLTPVRFSAANVFQTQVLTWKFPRLVKKKSR